MVNLVHAFPLSLFASWRLGVRLFTLAAKRLPQSLELGLAQFPPLARSQALQPQRANRDAHQAQRREANRRRHVPDLLLAALAQDQLQPHRLAIVADRLRARRRVRLRDDIHARAALVRSPFTTTPRRSGATASGVITPSTCAS